MDTLAFADQQVTKGHKVVIVQEGDRVQISVESNGHPATNGDEVAVRPHTRSTPKRPTRMNNNQIKKMKSLRRGGMSKKQIAEATGWSVSTVNRYI